MAVYYMSACHDCKQLANWDKTSQEQAYRWHCLFKKAHENHETQFGNDYDDDFYTKIFRYKGQHFKDKGVTLT
jgi:hypothetical protein